MEQSYKTNKNKQTNKTKLLFVLFLCIVSFFTSVTSGFSSEDMSSIETISQGNCEGLFANNFDPSDNLMSSVMSLCLPGVIRNLERLDQNQCEKILCEYEAAKEGISPIGCNKKSAYNTCLITGQGFNVVEGLLIGSLRENVRNILQNPIALGTNYLRKQAEQSLTCSGSCSSTTSKIAAIGLGGMEILSAYTTIQELVEEFSTLLDTSKTACEQLEEIKPELEKIVNDYRAAQEG